MVLENGMGGAITQGGNTPMFPSPSPSYSQDMFAQSQGAGAADAPALGAKSNRYRQSKQKGDSEQTDVERQYQKEIRELKKNLSREKRDCARLRAAVVTNQTQRAELEEFFLRCIESVKRDIGRRRKKAASKKSKGAEGEPTADMDQFTSTDRAKVIERLLEQDEVLAFLYDHLFPPNSGGAGSSPMQDSSFGPPIPGDAVAGSGANVARMALNSDTEAYLSNQGQ